MDLQNPVTNLSKNCEVIVIKIRHKGNMVYLLQYSLDLEEEVNYTSAS